MKLNTMGFGIGFRNRVFAGFPNGSEHFIRTGFAVVLLLAMMALVPGGVFAQTGIISGKVTDAQTGEPLPNARVKLEESGKSVVTDRDGLYIFRRVPGGTSTISVSYLGYDTVRLPVSLRSGEQVDQSFELDGDFLQGDLVYNQKTRQMQAGAMNKELQSARGVSVITTEQMDQSADYTVWGASSRLSGVQIGSRGEMSIRGTGLDMYNLTIDGQRMATTGFGSRGVDLDMIASDIFENLELIRVVTPDMDADAIGGVINLTTYRPVGGERRLDIRAGGGTSTRYFTFTGVGSRATLRYSESVTDNLALSVNIHQQTLNRSVESLGIHYDVYDFDDGAGLTDVVEGLSPRLTNDTRNMITADVQLAWQPTNRDIYHLRGWANYNSRDIRTNIDNYFAGGEWVRTDSTGDAGIYRHNANLDNRDLQQYMIGAGGRHHFDALTLEYKAGWEYSRINSRVYEFPFITEDLNYIVNMEDRMRPTMELTSRRFMLDDDSIDRRWITQSDFEQARNVHVDNTFSANVDAEIPIGPLALKVGSRARLTSKSGEYEEEKLRYVRNYRMLRFSKLRQRDFMVLDEYRMPWLVDSDNALNFFKSQRPLFTMDQNLFHERSEIWNYDVSENVYAGYGMATLDFGRFSLIGGARIEHTRATYEGRKVRMASNGVFEGFVKDEVDDDYTHLFPHAQLAFSPADHTNIRLAYSKTMRRHDFNLLSPFELVNRRDTTVFRGNPFLEPMLSNNFDLMLDHFIRTDAVISVRAFYKELDNFIYLRDQRINIREGDIAGFDPMFEDEALNVLPVYESRFQNSDESATIYGLELSWQQSLAFLPGIWRNFGLFANYTWSESDFDTDRNGSIALPYQSPHVVNAALDYTQGRVYTRVSYHWTAEYLAELGELSPAPAISRTQPVYMDYYQDGWSDLSVTFRFRIAHNFRFWVDVFNILPERERVRYQHTRDLYPTDIDYRGGFMFRTGIRYTF